MGDGIAALELRSFVERIERLEEEKRAFSEDIREVYAELKGRGYSPKAVRELVKLRRQDPAERREFEAILDVYRDALGMARAPIKPTPLEEAIERMGTPVDLTEDERADGGVAAFVDKKGHRMTLSAGRG